MQSFSGRSFLLFLVCAIAAGPVTAQPLDRLHIEPQDYGTQDSNYLFLSATQFNVNYGGTQYSLDSFAYLGLGVSCSACAFSRQLELPTGAYLESLRLYFYDLTLSNDITLQLCKSSVESDTGLNPAISCITANTTAAPGYGSLLLDVNETFLPLMQLDGDPALEEVRWLVLVQTRESITTQKFGGVKLKWKRQISPAPATATFADVPVGHPLHRFVEALADAGITGGCGGGNYCPDAPITRGQMAVFLSGALGLHWVP